MCAFLLGDTMKDIKYMNLAILQAKKAMRKDEVPIGAIIVKDNKVISKAFNKKESKKEATAHAEIIAIKKACKKLKNWRLSNCKLYCTMEPCMMCCGAILQSRISTVVYGVKNEQYGGTKNLIAENKNIKIIEGICKDECKIMIQTFFKKKRK